MADFGAGVQLVSWQNWSGAVQCPRSPLERPRNVDELERLIREHGAKGCLRAVGSGHSFVPFWNDGDTLLDLSAFSGLAGVEDGVARFGAGTPLHTIGPSLAQEGFALLNMGDIDRQTLAGAVATGTHGTGRGLGSLSAAVSGIELVDGRGEVRTLAAAELDAGRVALGLLGVMTAIDMRVIPAYGLHERNMKEEVEACLERFEARIAEHRHHEFWWVPRLDVCIAKTLDLIATPETAQLDELPFGEEGERWGASWQVFPSVRDLKFNEMEYAVPAASAMDCFRALRARMLDRFPKLFWPVEYRIVDGDDGWLSPTGGCEVATLSIHLAADEDPTELFAAVEPILRDYGGRPHWGKRHTLGRSELEALYPRLSDFVALRRQWDPEDRFLTPYLAALFR